MLEFDTVCSYARQSVEPIHAAIFKSSFPPSGERGWLREPVSGLNQHYSLLTSIRGW